MKDFGAKVAIEQETRFSADGRGDETQPIVFDDREDKWVFSA